MQITIAGIGYVGLSNVMLLIDYNKIYAVDIIPSKMSSM